MRVGGRNRSETGSIETALVARRRLRERVHAILHDEVGGLFTGVGLELELLRMEIAGENPAWASKIFQAQRNLDGAFDRVRDLSYEVHPDPVGKLGFEGAVNRLLDRMRRRYQGAMRVEFTSPEGVSLPLCSHCYEFLDCALDNALQHSYSGQLSISTTIEDADYCITVRDNGTGFDVNSVTPGFGIKLFYFLRDNKNMKLTIDTAPGSGTMVQLRAKRESKK